MGGRESGRWREDKQEMVNMDTVLQDSWRLNEFRRYFGVMCSLVWEMTSQISSDFLFCKDVCKIFQVFCFCQKKGVFSSNNKSSSNKTVSHYK